MKLGDHIHIGSGSVIEAAQIGSFVSIGSNVQIGKFAVIKDCVRIEDDTVIPPNATIASFSAVSGKPGTSNVIALLTTGLVVAELPESAQEEMDNHERYADFQTD
jgi:dynactin 5